MQIIGKADKDFILQVSEDEMANLIGYRDWYYANNTGEKSGANCRVGATIPIQKFWKDLETQRGLRKRMKQVHAEIMRIGADFQAVEVKIELPSSEE